MNTTIKIYQIEDVQNCVYAFRSYNKDMFDFEDYKQVAEFKYEEELTEPEILDKVFELGNTGILKTIAPKMRSVSCSDVIEINGRRYYVSAIGFDAIGKVEA